MNTTELDLSSLVLKHGAHENRDRGVCLLEAAAWMAGEPHTDHPACVDVALAAYGRSLNDQCSDEERQRLTALVPRLVGTKGSPDLAMKRAYLLVDGHLRRILPSFFRELPHRPRPDLAERFESLSPIVDAASAQAAREIASEARAAIPYSYNPAYAADAADAAYAAAHATAAAYAAAHATAAADAADAAYAADAATADAAYAAAAAADAADAAAFAADAAFAAYAAAAAAAHAAADFRRLRATMIDLRIAAFTEAIELREE